MTVKSRTKKSISILLCAVLVVTMIVQGLSVFAADITLDITLDGASVTERLEVQEYRSIELGYTLSSQAPDGSYIVWESNLPLLAGVDDNGKVTGYDYSKAAVIQLWLDEEVRPIPLIGEAMASAIESAFESSGIDLETANTDMIVAVVSAISPELGESLKSVLDNMNVKITATLYDADSSVLASDTVEVIVTKSIIANVAPTGVHITNKRAVPTTVAVGTTVQLYGACTPVRLGQGIKWSMGSSVFDGESSKHATVSEDGLVTFTSAGTATVRVNPSSDLYAALFSDTVTFEVLDPADLPVTDFTITGETDVTEGSTTQLAIDNLTPEGAYTGSVVWESSDPSIAVVDQHGVVTGLDGGSGLVYSKTATISATIDGVTRSVTVTVKRNFISSIAGVEISGDTAVGIGNSASYTASVSPSRLDSNKDVVRRWGIIDSLTGEKIYANGGEAANTIAKINDSGILTGLSSGTVIIFVEAEYNETVVEDQIQVIVGKAITDFAITGTTSLKEGDSAQLSISSILPSDYDPAILDTVVWTVDNPSVASVDSNGVVKGLDAGGRLSTNTQTAVVTATIGAVSRSITVTVKGQGLIALNQYTGGQIVGPDCVVVDFPYQYSATHTPTRIDVTRQLWGVATDNGEAPWTSDKYFGADDLINPFEGNFENSYLSVNSENGTVTAKQAGKTTLWTYMANALSTYQDITREIEVVELTPKSITITAPDKYEYLEGETQLDLTGLEVKLTYDRDELALYYPEAASYTDEQMTVAVTDYTVSAIDPTALDKEQYIIVTVNRAGKDMRAIFPILVKSKQVDTIEITNAPRYEYLEGETELDLTGLTVVANYLNAPSEEITDYIVNTNDFNPQTLDTEQQITVTYNHAGRSASATFPVIIYGIPVVSVSTGDYSGGWTNKDVTFELDSTHQLGGITYYYKTESSDWQALTGNTLTVSTDTDETYYFKAINGKLIESSQTIGYKVSIDKIVPVFELTPEIEGITNQSYGVTVNVGTIGASGIASVILDGEYDITSAMSFTVDENGTHTVKVISFGGLESEQTININNIDKEAPAVLKINLEHKEMGGFARFINTITFGLFFNKTVEVQITAEDYGVAGVDCIEYRYTDENGEPVSDWEVYDDTDRPLQDPQFKGYVEARATDRAANVSAVLRSDGFVIDADAPTDIMITASDADGFYESDTWTSTDVTIKLKSTAFSDIYAYYYSLSGGEWVEMEGDTLTVSAQGVSDYKFKAVSNSDLESAQAEFIVKIDRVTPVIRVDFEGTFGRWTYGGVKFSFSMLEEPISGVTYYYDNGNGWTEITSGAEIVLNDSVNATYIFKAVNGAGIESTPSDSYRVMIDSVTPTVEFTPSVTELTQTPYSVGLKVTAGEAGLKSISMNGRDITGQDSVTVTGNGEYVFVLVGNNGIVSTQVLTVDNFYSYSVKVDSVTLAGESGGFSNYYSEPFGKMFSENTVVTITASASEGAPGRIEYRLLNENGEPTGDWQIYSDSDKPVIAPNFKGYVEARAFGSDGATASDIVRSEGFTVDGIAPAAPAVQALYNGGEYSGEWAGKEIDIVLTSSAYSGILSYYYRVDSGEWIRLAGNTLTINENGEHVYDFKAVSKAGLESGVSTLTAKIESVVPALLVEVDGTIGHRTYDDVTFRLSVSNGISGVTYYYNTGSGWTEMNGNTLTVSESCDRTYTFKAVSRTGIESNQSPSYRVIVDKNYLTVEKKPILSVGVSGTLDSYTADLVVFSLSAAECEGEAQFYYDNGNGWQPVNGSTLAVSTIGSAVYKFKAVDASGRTSLESAEYKVMLDTLAPTLSVMLDSTDFTNTARTATVNAQAGISGIKSVTVNGEDITDSMSFKVTQNGKYTVTVTANNSKSTTQVLTVESFDYSAPQITDISMEHKNTGGFARFINTITFGLFFNEKTEITITANDTGASGLKNIEYRLLDENSDAVSDWAQYDEDNKPCIETEFKGYVEARATDEAGNVSAAVSSKGFVVDTKAPEDIKVTAEVNGKEYDGSYVSEDIVLTPDATAFSDIYAYMYRVDGGDWIKMTGESITAEEGLHKYEFKAQSNSGLESGTAAVITKCEKGVPEVKTQVIGVTGEWTVNDVVIVLSAVNCESGVTYYYDNGDGWTEMNGNTLTVSEAVNAEYRFKAVNAAGSESAESESVKIMVDKAVPTIEVTAESEEYTNENVILSVTAGSTGISGVKSVTVNGEALEGDSFTAAENGDYEFEITLNNGNSARKVFKVTTIDREAPEVLGITLEHKESGDFAKFINKISFGLFFNKTVEVTIEAKDNGEAGTDRIEYRFVDENGDPISDFKTYNAENRPAQDPEFKGYVEARAVDTAGNVSETFRSQGFIIDSASPEDVKVTANGGKYTAGEWTSSDVEIQLSSSAFSDIDKYYYSLSGGEWVEMNGSALTVTAQGINEYRFKAVSNSGIESAVTEFTVNIDKQTPVVRVQTEGVTGGWTTEKVTFKVSSASDSDSGLTFYYSDGTGWKELEGDTLEVSAACNTAYSFKAVNNAGTESGISDLYKVMIDPKAPTLSVMLDSTDFTNTARTATVNAQAGISGIKSVTVNGEDITDSMSFKVTQNGKYTVTVTANNSKSTTQVLTVESFDYSAPQITDISMEHKNTGGFARFINTITFGLFFNEKTEITITANDTGASGLKNIEYRLLDENSDAVSDWAQYDEDNKPCIETEFKGYVEARATDEAGNVSAAVSSKGFVVDTKAPEDIKVTAEVNGKEYDGSYVSEDIVLTPDATAFSDIYAYMYRVDGGDWIKMTGESITAEEGLHKYEFKAQSNSGLESGTAAVITKCEKGVPEVKTQVIGVTGEWTVNDVVIVLSAVNCESGVTYYYDNGDGWTEMNGNTLTVSEAVNAEYRFKAVNAAGSESAESESVKIMVDKAVPTIEVTAESEEYTNENVILSVTAGSTGISGVKSVTVNGEALEGDSFTAAENGDYEFEITLNNGNSARKVFKVTTIDREAPGNIRVELPLPAGVIDGVSVYGSEVAVAISAADSGVSGIEKIEYRAVNTEGILAKVGFDGLWRDYDEENKPVIGDGFMGYIEVRVTDKAGNVSEIFTSGMLIVDATAPVIDADIAAGSTNVKDGDTVSGSVVINLDAQAASDIEKYQYSLNGGEWTDMDSSTLTVEEDGAYSYRFRAISNSGIESEEFEISFTIDNTPASVPGDGQNSGNDSQGQTGNSGDSSQSGEIIPIPDTSASAAAVSVVPLALAAAVIIAVRRKKSKKEE